MRAYRYGCRPPASNEKLVSDQLFLAHRYKNQLIEIERGRRAAIREVPDGDPEVRKVALKDCDRVAAAKVRAARAASGLYWGTYLLIEDAASRIRQSSGNPRDPVNDPGFRRYDGTGKIGVQLQNGLSVEDLMAGGDTRARLAQAPDRSGVTAGSRRSAKRFVLSLRVGSEGRAPIWATFSITLHRPLPPTAMVKWVEVNRVRVGPDYRWFAIFSVDDGLRKGNLRQTLLGHAGVVAIDLGWRKRPDGTRVGYWLDDQGNRGECLTPNDLPERLTHIESIGAIRKRAFNAFLPQLVEWASVRRDYPEWFTARTETLAQWESPDRLFTLVRFWRDRRFVDDAAIWPVLEAWAKQDLHLARWYAHGKAKILGCRDETYRILAKRFATRYETIVIEKFALPAVAGRRALGPSPTNAEKVIADATSSRRHATAPGTFRAALVNACSRWGARLVEAPAAWTTLTCSQCGLVERWDKMPLEHTCVKCGAVWDQDWNACVNLLGTFSSGGGVEKTPKALAQGMSAKQKRFRKSDALSRRSEDAEMLALLANGGEGNDTPQEIGDAAEKPAQGEDT